VRHAAASTASRPNVRDDGQRPSSGQDGGTSSFDLPDGESEIFLQRGLDRILLICPSGKVVESSQENRLRRQPDGAGFSFLLGSAASE
jgi:hypothetical protein